MGSLANLGAIPALVQKREFLLVDEKSHASIVDACTLAKNHGAKILIYRHNDIGDLTEKLTSCGKSSGKLIVTDGVFSMGGDLAPLDKLYDLAKIHQAALYVDDAHGTWVIGNNGRGTAELFNLDQGQIDLTMVTLSKAIPAIGGCIIGKKEVIDYLKLNSRSFIFNLSLPPVMVAIALAALDVIKEEQNLRQTLNANADFMKKEFRRMGFDIGQAAAAIVPVFIRNDQKTIQLADRLGQAGFLADPMIYPAVGKQESLIRLVITAAHSPDDLARAVGVFQKAGKELGIIT